MFKTGYITIIGKPNAGKSTLTNKLVGFKVAITTPKPQTTRFNIKGIITNENSQMIFTDTPGIHTPKTKLGKYMMDGVKNATESVDVILYLVDASRPKIDTASEKMMNDLAITKTPIILVINKIDKIEKTRILEVIKLYNDYFTSIGGTFKEIIPISALKKDNIDILKQIIRRRKKLCLKLQMLKFKKLQGKMVDY